ncbi:hypothetical protein AB1283_00720 [Bacillus sp. S13(2024)]|uniref:hypothetical protein n=1 Tax=Bacillus sp. S13(2024) TaxID=3162885 RepID=UPI003D25E145
MELLKQTWKIWIANICASIISYLAYLLTENIQMLNLVIAPILVASGATYYIYKVVNNEEGN